MQLPEDRGQQLRHQCSDQSGRLEFWKDTCRIQIQHGDAFDTEMLARTPADHGAVGVGQGREQRDTVEEAGCVAAVPVGLHISTEGPR